MNGTSDIAELLRHASWMRRLARSLTGDVTAADDLVQDTWLLALRSPPRTDVPTRPWLSQVLRNARRERFRGDERRERREQAADEPAAASSSEQLVEAVEQQRLLADLVLALDEPYRSTLLLRFYEGLSAADIAARQELPAGTVRWRLKTALAELRKRLDRRHGGDRQAWTRALLPLTAGGAGKGLPPAALKSAPLLKWGAAGLLAAGSLTTALALQPRPPTAARATPTTSAQRDSAQLASAGALLQALTQVPPTASARAVEPGPGVGGSTAAAASGDESFDRFSTPATPKRPAPASPPTFDSASIAAQVAELEPIFNSCFVRAREGDPRLHGQITLVFTIVPDAAGDGVVTDLGVDVDKSTIADPGMRACVREAMSAARFAAPADARGVRVEYPLAFEEPK